MLINSVTSQLKSVIISSHSHVITISVSKRLMYQVADEYLAPDVLSTVKEMKAVNFRRVPKMPVYGVAQPTSEVQHFHQISRKALVYSEAIINLINPKHKLEGMKSG